MTKNIRDCRDTFVMGAVTAAWTAGTVWVFLHPSEGAFATWAGLASVMIGCYHWLTMLDDKRPDRGESDAGPA